MAQEAKATTAAPKADKGPFRMYQVTINGKTFAHRTRGKTPIAVLAGIQKDGTVDVYRWTSSEKLTKRGLTALKKADIYTDVLAVPPKEITKEVPLLKLVGHNQTFRVVSQAEYEAAKPAPKPKKAKATAATPTKGASKIFGTKKSAIENRPEGMTVKDAKAAVKKVSGGFAY